MYYKMPNNNNNYINIYPTNNYMKKSKNNNFISYNFQVSKSIKNPLFVNRAAMKKTLKNRVKKVLRRP